MLIKDVAGEFGGRVKVLTEEYGNSEMATRYGVRRYPVVFVDDVLVARPKDFGFAGPEDSAGRYVPWREPSNQERFKRDLRTMVTRRLQGEKIEGVAAEDEADLDGPATLPPGSIARLSALRSISTRCAAASSSSSCGRRGARHADPRWAG